MTVNQTVYNGMQTANRTRQAESNTSIARETLRVTEQTILLNAATAYMDLLRDTALLELQRRNVEVLQEQLRQTRDRFIVGEVTRTDVAQAETNLAAGRAQVLVAEANFARSKATYRQVVCVEPGTLAPGAPVDRLLPPRLPLAVQFARARHPSVGVAMFGIDFAALQVKINEGSLYPTATIVGTVQQQWETDLTRQALQQFNAFVLGQLSVPIYQGGQEYSLIRQAKETVGQKRIDLDTARDAAQANVITVWAQLEAVESFDLRDPDAGGERRDRAQRRARGSARRPAHHPRRPQCDHRARQCAHRARHRPARSRRRLLRDARRRRRTQPAEARTEHPALRSDGPLSAGARRLGRGAQSRRTVSVFDSPRATKAPA